jgi:hypothetical protein
LGNFDFYQLLAGGNKDEALYDREIGIMIVPFFASADSDARRGDFEII